MRDKTTTFIVYLYETFHKIFYKSVCTITVNIKIKRTNKNYSSNLKKLKHTIIFLILNSLSNRAYYESTKICKKVLFPAISSKTCPICLCHVSEHLAAVISPCLHTYCVECIEKWSKIKRKCPLCNCGFSVWFYRIDLCNGTFLEKRLRKEEREIKPRNYRPVGVGRVVRRSREESNSSNQRSRPLPRRRWFRKPGPQSSDAIAQRVLQWRLSIYEQRLQAVPHFCGSNPQSNTRNNAVKERISRRIEPWIRRELEAILGDPDPSIILHVASSLFISSLDTNNSLSFDEDKYLDPLRPFLHGFTNMFWHELRCFAGSPFNMETYDTVVEYRKMIE